MDEQAQWMKLANVLIDRGAPFLASAITEIENNNAKLIIASAFNGKLDNPDDILEKIRKNNNSSEILKRLESFYIAESKKLETTNLNNILRPKQQQNKELTPEAQKVIKKFLLNFIAAPGLVGAAIIFAATYFTYDILLEKAELTAVKQVFQDIILYTQEAKEASDKAKRQGAEAAKIKSEAEVIKNKLSTQLNDIVGTVTNEVITHKSFLAIKDKITNEVNSKYSKLSTNLNTTQLALNKNNQALEDIQKKINNQSEQLSHIVHDIKQQRVVFGKVSYNNKGNEGNGFNVVIPKIGEYKITFDPPFNGPYSLNVMPVLTGNEKYVPYITVKRYIPNGAIVSTTKYEQKAFSEDREPTKFSWYFYAIGKNNY